MSLFRQLLLAILVSALLGVTGSFVVSTMNARSYLEQQLTMKNTDNANTLALLMSQQDKDPVLIELQVAAVFDGGHYEFIRVVGADGQVIAERRAAESDDAEVPAWFMHLIPLQALMGEAQIGDGWRQFARISLASHTRFAYRDLWQGTLDALLLFLAVGGLSSWIGFVILGRIKRPLLAVIRQANAIAERRFVVIDEPKTPELRQVAAAMNQMVVRLKEIFSEEAQRLEAVRREANFDVLSGLPSRGYFLGQLRTLIAGAETTAQGFLVVLHLHDLAAVNLRLGRARTDDLIRRVGAWLQAESAQQAGSLVGRLSGADFALVVDSEQALLAAGESLMAHIAELGHEEAALLSPLAFLAHAEFRAGMPLGEVLAKADLALAATEEKGCIWMADVPEQLDASLPATSMADWHQILSEAIAKSYTVLVDYPVLTAEGALVHLECFLRLKFAADGEWFSAGKFMPMAIRLKMTHEIDMAVLNMAIHKLRQGGPALAINMSVDTLAESSCVERIVRLLRTAPDVCAALCIEFPEAGVFEHFFAFSHFCHSVRSLGVRVGIERFGRQFEQISRLHGLGMDYLKVDASFVHEIENQAGNQRFLKGLTGMAHSIGLVVIAEGVQQAAEATALIDLGFDGLNGAYVNRWAETLR